MVYTRLERAAAGPNSGKLEPFRVEKPLSAALWRLAQDFVAYVWHVTGKIWQRDAFHAASDPETQLPCEITSGCDFSEKLSFKYAQEAMSMYWTSVSISILVIIAYFVMDGKHGDQVCYCRMIR